MKQQLFSSRHIIVLVGCLAAAGNWQAALAADTRTNAPTRTAVVSSNDAPTEIEIPQSVFVLPQSKKDGRDPFFPRSVRLDAVIPVPVPTNPPSPLDLKINGTSGNEERPLVIINNVTFGVGDTYDVVTGGRRVAVRCVEIELSTGRATVEVAGNRRVLFFQKSGK